MKTAKNSHEAFEVGEQYKGQPHGWVQWKGTDVCMDVRCECGKHTHVDAMFAYNVECPYCGAVYACNGHIEFIKLTKRPDDGCIVMGEKSVLGEDYD